jgi:hypothetical protein
MDAELRADLPTALQQQVREMLDDWVRMHTVSLESEARARLDSSICGLVKDTLRAFRQE